MSIELRDTDSILGQTTTQDLKITVLAFANAIIPTSGKIFGSSRITTLNHGSLVLAFANAIYQQVVRLLGLLG